MVARKRTKLKVKENNLKTEVCEGKKTEKSENEITKMEVDNPGNDIEKVKANKWKKVGRKTEKSKNEVAKMEDKPGKVSKKVMASKGKKVREGKKTEKSKNKVAKMEVDKPGKDGKKDKLHKIIKTNMKTRVRRKGKKNRALKLQILKMLDDGADSEAKKETVATGKPAENLKVASQWEIIFTGIPTKWKGNVDELISDYKRFNLEAFALRRENWDQQWCQVLHLFFKTEHDLKEAAFSGPKIEVMGKLLSLKVNPIRMVYVSNVPYDVDEETAYAELKEVLGSGVYNITFPRNSGGQLLGHAIAYAIDEASQKELLDGRKLNLWKGEQYCCTKEDFFKRFVLTVISGWLGYLEVLNDLVQTLKALDIQVSLDLRNRKLYFLDESSVKQVLKKSGLEVGGRKMIFSQSGSVRFVMKSIKRDTPKSELLALLHKIQAFNFKYHENRCKAIFEVPAEDVEKCKALHLREVAGRNVEVYKCGSEELKASKERSQKKLEEYLVENDIKFSKDRRLRSRIKYFWKRSGKGSNVQKTNKSKGKIRSKKVNRKVKKGRK